MERKEHVMRKMNKSNSNQVEKLQYAKAKSCFIRLTLSWFINEVLSFDPIHYSHTTTLYFWFSFLNIFVYNVQYRYLQQRPFSLILKRQVGMQDTFIHILLRKPADICTCTLLHESWPMTAYRCKKHDLLTRYTPTLEQAKG